MAAEGWGKKEVLYSGGGRPRKEFLIGAVKLQLSVTNQMCHLNMLLLRENAKDGKHRKL